MQNLVITIHPIALACLTALVAYGVAALWHDVAEGTRRIRTGASRARTQARNAWIVLWHGLPVPAPLESPIESPIVESAPALDLAPVRRNRRKAT